MVADRFVLATMLAVGLAACTTPAAPDAANTFATDAAIEPAPAGAVMARVAAVVDAADFHGEILVSPDADTVHRLVHDDFSGEPAWPWASVTKQVLATMVMQEVQAGTLDLSTPVGDILPQLANDSPTIEQLLRHASGLANPSDTQPDAEGVPAFYTADYDALSFCTSNRKGRAGEGPWSYNNCDYIVLGAMLERLNAKPFDTLVQERIGSPSGWTDTRLLGADEMREFAAFEPAYRRIARYGASAALVGPLEDMVRFDRALLGGKLIEQESRARLWQGDPAAGFMALGQWSFEAPLAGCETAVRIVERRGGIGKYQVRNIILPQSGTVLAIATDRGEDEFAFGEIWTGQGFMHDVLSAAACP